MKFTALTLSIIVVFLAACVNLKPRADKVVLYTLGNQTELASAPADGLTSYYVARPELPGFLAGSAMAYHRDSGELGYISGARWGEDLSEGIARTLAEYLQATGQVPIRSQYPWPKLSREDPDIRILFQRFSAKASGEIEILAVWQIRDSKGLVKEGNYQSTDLRWKRGAPESYVAQLNAALEALAESIAREP